MSMMMLWPIALGVCSELLYQICAKSTPAEIHPLASLSVTYAVGAVTSVALYYLLSKDGNLTREYAHINWAVLLLDGDTFEILFQGSGKKVRLTGLYSLQREEDENS